MVSGFAPSYTYLNNESDVTPAVIDNGDSIWVYGITFSTTGQDVPVNLYEGDGTTLIMQLRIRINSSFNVVTPFLAPRGLSVSGIGANQSCTVFHSNAGF